MIPGKRRSNCNAPFLKSLHLRIVFPLRVNIKIFSWICKTIQNLKPCHLQTSATPASLSCPLFIFHNFQTCQLYTAFRFSLYYSLYLGYSPTQTCISFGSLFFLNHIFSETFQPTLSRIFIPSPILRTPLLCLSFSLALITI